MCVCVCVFGLVEIKRYFFTVGGTNEARRRNFQIQNQRHFARRKLQREEKSRAPLEHFWHVRSVRVSGPNKQRSRCGHFWTHTSHEMSKMVYNCITHPKSRVNPIVLIGSRFASPNDTIHMICTSETKGRIHRSFCGAVRNVATPPHLVALEVCPLRPTYRRPDRDSGLLYGGDTSANR